MVGADYSSLSVCESVCDRQIALRFAMIFEKGPPLPLHVACTPMISHILNFGTFGPKSDAKSITFYTTFGHGRFWSLLVRKVMRKAYVL